MMSIEKKTLLFPKNGVPTLVSNDWQVLSGIEDQADLPTLTLGSPKVLLPFSMWRQLVETQINTQVDTQVDTQHSDSELMIQAKQGRVGVWFAADDDILQHAECILAGKALWPVVAAHFPVFKDGRSFSTAALLRNRFGWQGQVRAIGDVLIDQLLQGARVGFDAFDLRVDQNLEVALGQFDLFSVATQNSWREKRTQFAA
jgi:uncharacterized protein (DUF934 family)